MPNIRRKAEVLEVFRTVTKAQHDQLKVDGVGNKALWSETDGVLGVIVKQFKSETKEHYYRRQGRLCCYCSKELDAHNGSFDAEHIIDKDGYPQFMFCLENIAAVCKTCNGAKSNKYVLAPGVGVDDIPLEPHHYLLVHPHKDEWSDHLDYDAIGRIVAKAGSPKGLGTIGICGINYLNAARLADHFLPADSAEAEKNLEGFFRVKRKAWKLKKIQVLRSMADEFDLAKARAIIEVLEQEIEGG
ncbi:hypothetical protein GV729_02565 [Pseudomonas sp. Fl4BN2]|nr:hypothetical protein [Pseudomonas sp. Fl4BN2]